MNKQSEKLKHHKSGSAIITVIVIFMVIMIIMGAAISIFGSNLRQAKYQENSIRAHYIALAGIDLATSALLQEGPGGKNDTLLYDHFRSSLSIASTPTLSDSITLENGLVEISIKALDSGGKRWIEVKSKGILTSGKPNKTIKLRFLADNPLEQDWDMN